MFNTKQMLEQLIQVVSNQTPSESDTSAQNGADTSLSGILGGLLNNSNIASAGGGLLAGLLLGNKNTRSAGFSYGSAATLGALALKVYQSWQATKSQTDSVNTLVTSVSDQNMSSDQVQKQGKIMLSAMIAAAKSDGNFDEQERQQIEENLNTDDPELVQWVQAEMCKPLNADGVAALATSPEIAAQIYFVSLLVIRDQNQAETAYLDQLGDKLHLDPQFRTEIAKQIPA